MLFSSVPAGAVFTKGHRIFVKNCNFPKLGFGKATELLGEANNPRRMFADNTPVTMIVFNHEASECQH